MAGLKLERIECPDRGLDTEAAPAAISKRYATELVNLLPGTPGRLRMRGSLSTGYDTTFTQAGALWSGTDFVLVGGMTADDTFKQVHYAGTVQTVTATDNENIIIHEQHTELYPRIYGRVTDENGDDVVGGWNAGGPTLTAHDNSPLNFTDLATFQNRLVVLSGEPPGGGTNNPYVLYFSDVGGPDADNTAQWQDDTSGLTNQLRFAGEGEPIALARCGRSLMVCMDRSMWLMTGSSPQNWQINKVFAEIGIRAEGSIVETASGFYFLSNRGSFCFTDGVTWREVSQPISTDLMSSNSLTQAIFLNHGYIFLTVPGGDAYMFHIETESWSKFVASVGQDNNDSPRLLARTTRGPWIYYRDDPGYLYPAGALDNFGASATGMDAGTHPIEMSMTTRLVALGSPISRAQLNEVIVEYKFMTDDEDITSGFTVEVLTPFDEDVLDSVDTDVEYNLTSHNDPGKRMRLVHESFEECEDVYVRLSWEGAGQGTSSVLDAEIHDIYLVWQDSHRQISQTPS